MKERPKTPTDRIADRLDSWDGRGGINLIAGTTLEGLLGEIADSLASIARSLETSRGGGPE